MLEKVSWNKHSTDHNMEDHNESTATLVPSNQPQPAPRPRPAPRKLKPPVTSIDSPSVPANKPDLPSKPKPPTKPKPVIAAKPKASTLQHSKTETVEPSDSIRKQRPLSIKVTDDSARGMVASELASILSRPRGSSKGLLSPTDYSSSDSKNVVVAKEDGSNPTTPTVSPPIPKPRPRLSPTSGAPITPSDTPTASAAHSNADTRPSLSPSSTKPVPSAEIAQSVDSKHAKSSEHKTDIPAEPVEPSRKPKPALPPPPSKPPSRPPPPSRPARRPANHTPTKQEENPDAGQVTSVNNAEASQPKSQPPSVQTNARRKLEITVLGARPMNEVGFRDLKAPNGTSPTQPKVINNTEVRPGVTTQGQRTVVEPVRHEQKSSSSMNRDEALDVNNDRSPSSPPKTETNANSQSPPGRPTMPASTPTKRPTIIRPSRQSLDNTTSHTDTDVLVSKTSEPAPKSRPQVMRPAERPGGTSDAHTKPTVPQATEIKRDPPKSLDIKKDPWNQMAKEESKPVNENNESVGFIVPSTDSKPLHQHTDVSKPTKTIMDQSIENDIPLNIQPNAPLENEPEPAMFFHSVTQSSQPKESTGNSKPSALQRIYEYKRVREEQQPDKYKHRPDCYVDKPNNDGAFWKPRTKPPRPSFTPPTSSKNSQDTEENSDDVSKGSTKKAIVKGALCKAMFDFDGETDSDLAFKEGNVIQILQRIDEDWYRGELNNKTGVFPVTYVEILKEKTTSQKNKQKEGPHFVLALVAFEYKGAEPNDLSLKAGQEVKVTAKIDSERLYGEAGGKCGVFPSIYVSVSEDDIELLPIHVVKNLEEAKHSTPVASEQWATALYDFTAENETEMSLKAGVRVKILGSVDGEWTNGGVDGCSGLFPTAFVEIDKATS